RAVIHRRDQHRRALDVRILLHRQRRNRPPAHEHDHEVDYDREDRMPDERVSKRAHERFSDQRDEAPATRTASRSLKDPEVATCWPGVRPLRITTSSSSTGPLRTGCTCARLRPAESATIKKTWSPLGPLRRALTGIETTVVAGPTGTSTRTEAPGAGAWLGIRARTNALRVVASIRASTATIRAVSGRGSLDANTATGS